MASLFATDMGQKVLAHLTDITINRIAGAPEDLDHQNLAHREGQRYIVSYIWTCIKRGKHANQ